MASHEKWSRNEIILSSKKAVASHEEGGQKGLVAPRHLKKGTACIYDSSRWSCMIFAPCLPTSDDHLLLDRELPIMVTPDIWGKSLRVGPHLCLLPCMGEGRARQRPGWGLQSLSQSQSHTHWQSQMLCRFSMSGQHLRARKKCKGGLLRDEEQASTDSKGMLQATSHMLRCYSSSAAQDDPRRDGQTSRAPNHIWLELGSADMTVS